jgi:hypothetical protein
MAPVTMTSEQLNPNSIGAYQDESPCEIIMITGINSSQDIERKRSGLMDRHKYGQETICLNKK